MTIETQPQRSQELGRFAVQNISPEKKKMFEEQDEVLRSLEKPFFENLLNRLTPVDKIWQPSEILPDLSSPDWEENLRSFRKETDGLSDGFMAVLVFHGLTEEAIPAYHATFGRFPAISDETGISQNPYARFVRDWTAEEKRHGDFIRSCLYLSGRVNMKAYERSEMSLIRNGFTTGIEPGDSYGAICYPSDQEEKTVVATKNAGNLAEKEGSPTVMEGLNKTASDETRHKNIYQPLYKEIFRLDPNGAMLAFRRTQMPDGRKSILMPAGRVTTGRDSQIGPTMLFGSLVRVELSMGGYTMEDDATILGNLIQTWGVEDMQGLSNEADQARYEILDLYKEKCEDAKNQNPKIFERSVRLPWFENPIPLSKSA